MFYTPSVAATSFFAGEVEIFDFVTERVKRCIAAKRCPAAKSLTPKTLHAVVSHQNILANMCGICGPFRDKNFTMYDFANAVSSVGLHPDAWDMNQYTIVSDDI